MYLEKDLEKAFNKVKSLSHWKNPINKIIAAKDKDIVNEAIIYFTATVPTFEKLSNTNKVNENMWLRVKADGYRMGPAGDH